MASAAGLNRIIFWLELTAMIASIEAAAISANCSSIPSDGGAGAGSSTDSQSASHLRSFSNKKGTRVSKDWGFATLITPDIEVSGHAT